MLLCRIENVLIRGFYYFLMLGFRFFSYLCTVSFHHASHMNSEPGWNFCFGAIYAEHNF